MAPIDAQLAAAISVSGRAPALEVRPPLRVCVLGFGNVGQALAGFLAEQPSLAARLHVVAIADRGGVAASAGALDPAALLASKRQRGTIAEQPRPPWLDAWVRQLDCDVVVDLLPSNLDTGEPTRSIAIAALRSGKEFVTANKGLLALHGPEILEIASQTGRAVRSGAAVGGGTPVLELISNAFRGDQVLRFTAVLNGSTNFVLGKLEGGSSWEGALAAARARGILEADPSLDLSGRDAAAKGVILANALWDGGWTLRDARVEGIGGLDPGEVQEAAARGLAIRLIVRGDPQDGVRVAPVALPREHPLVVEGVENAVRLTLRSAGTVTLTGPGAGGVESASKVLSDILALARPR